MQRIFKTNLNMLVRNKSINFFSAIENFSTTQDTVINQKAIELKNNLIIKDSSQKEFTRLSPVKEFNLQAIDSILKRSEERERQIEFEKQQVLIQKPVYKRKIDTTELLYKQFGIAGFPIKEKLDNDPFQHNFLYNFSCIKPKEKNEQEVFSYVSNEVQSQTIKSQKEIVKPKYFTERIQFDWVTILLIASFLLLGWVRLFNKKYLISIVKSTVSYKESNTLYREKNVLMERASFLINLLFISNVALFILHLKQYLEIEILGIDEYVLYFIVFGSLMGLYVFRAISSSFIGYLFLKQKVFAEYFHNVNIYTKSTGLALLPMIIALQFIAYEYLGIIIYIGISIAGFLYLLQLLRAFQIIIRNNVSIFYMILYLCAFEITPFLIVYKLLLSQG